MDQIQIRPPKHEVFRALLLRGSVFVHLDPRKDGVIVPQRLRSQPQVVLQWGLDMPVPITDMSYDERFLQGTLSFKGIPFTCVLPWSAVFAIVGEDAKGMVWEEVMPGEVKEEIAHEQAKVQSDAKARARRASITALPTDPDFERKPTGIFGKPKDKPSRAHLKVVK